ncbi:MAG: ATP-binding protein [Coleofasciculus chthonoplastes F3-SA18-01]|jgi:two-component system NtrC family sensor kinase|uniref:sensor histidine kinase n=1 Tax=Coleofasciculus chthonoplastes TaxID=64178 RepID=UPI0033028BD8
MLLPSSDRLLNSPPDWSESDKPFSATLAKQTRQLQALNEELADQIPERQDMELALKKYRSMFEGAVEGIFQTTPDGHFIDCNPALVKIYGYASPAELLETLTDIGQQLYVNPNRRRDFIEKLRSHDSVTDFESQVYRKDGQIIWICENARAVRDQEGKLLYYEGFVTDITQRKVTEESLRRSQAKYKAQAEQLEETLNQLRQTQQQLIEKEHLSTLGKLLAGVAHEINNPVNFLCNNFPHAQQYTTDLLKLLQLYHKYNPQPAPEIQQEAEEIDLDFLLKDFPKTLSSMQMGAERLRQLVYSLKTLSGGNEEQSIDIHQGLDSTLVMLYYRLKSKGNKPEIKVFKDYSKLPLVTCYSCGLNQVFMNVLCNAIDALKDMRSQPANGDSEQTITPSIWIRTELIDNGKYSGARAVIRIKDNGPGINDELKQRIFEPFFTTKPPGKGTGLGLSISHQIIVEKHGGTFTCNSTPGQGTEFVIKIPI